MIPSEYYLRLGNVRDGPKFDPYFGVNPEDQNFGTVMDEQGRVFKYYLRFELQTFIEKNQKPEQATVKRRRSRKFRRNKHHHDHKN